MASVCFSIFKLNFKNYRIESVLAELFPNYSRRHFSKALDDRQIKVNGKIVKKAAFIKLRDQIEIPQIICRSYLGAKRINLSDNVLNVVFEHADFLVLNKPREMHSVLQRQDDPVTLADLVYKAYPETLQAGKSTLESGLVQRLDYYTFGLILAARNRVSWEVLHNLLARGKVIKTYLALLEGELRFSPDSNVEIISFKEGQTLVKFQTNLGSRHIVRKFFSNLGYPLKGDLEYGSKNKKYSLFMNKELEENQGFFLMASDLSFNFNSETFQFSLTDSSPTLAP